MMRRTRTMMRKRTKMKTTVKNIPLLWWWWSLLWLLLSWSWLWLWLCQQKKMTKMMKEECQAPCNANLRIRNELLQLLSRVAIVDVVLGLDGHGEHGLGAQQGDVEVGVALHHRHHHHGLQAQQRQGE